MSSLVLNLVTVFHCFWPYTPFIFWPGRSPPYSSSLTVYHTSLLLPSPAHWSFSVSYLTCLFSLQGLPTMLPLPRPLFTFSTSILLLLVVVLCHSPSEGQSLFSWLSGFMIMNGNLCLRGICPVLLYMTLADCSISAFSTWLKSPQGQGLGLSSQIMRIRPSTLEMLNQNDVF